MMEAVMYGPTPIRATEKLISPPPVKMFKREKAELVSRKLLMFEASTPGIGIAETNRLTITSPKTIKNFLRKSGIRKKRSIDFRYGGMGGS
jgi:hypothetical protein